MRSISADDKLLRRFKKGMSCCYCAGLGFVMEFKNFRYFFAEAGMLRFPADGEGHSPGEEVENIDDCHSICLERGRGVLVQKYYIEMH